MKHFISAGALVVKEGHLLLVRHYEPGRFDYWAPPGGGAEGDEELAKTATRETFEETGIICEAKALAYIDELIDPFGRMVKFWFFAEFVSGDINVGNNPAANERTVEAGWFARDHLPDGHVFPRILRGRFWDDLANGFPAPIKLPLQHSVFPT
ncbi:NUDIX domain-containing protein [uncultured Roseobacter sp.]|uniref:NUDIX domain-containing protein n=1 Tax=uncultured Roseobacter sp. TaxID=114847 RepID=UPI00260FC430|nr:NUDIX domain-containing protein [uncultured Roseobacter sp.]